MVVACPLPQAELSVRPMKTISSPAPGHLPVALRLGARRGCRTQRQVREQCAQLPCTMCIGVLGKDAPLCRCTDLTCAPRSEPCEQPRNLAAIARTEYFDTGLEELADALPRIADQAGARAGRFENAGRW